MEYLYFKTVSLSTLVGEAGVIMSEDEEKKDI